MEHEARREPSADAPSGGAGDAPAGGPVAATDAAYADRLENLRRVGAVLLAADSPDAVARTCLQALAERVEIVRGSVSELDYDRGETVVLAVVGDGSGGLDPGTRMPMAERDVLHRYEAGERLQIDDLAALACPSGLEQALLAKGVRSYVNIPLLAEGQLIGSLNLGASRPHGFAPDHLEFAEDLANLVAVAVREARLRQQLREKSAALEETVVELLRVDAWRMGLVNMLAHDVRAPLATAVSMLDFVLQRLGALEPERVRELVQGAQRSARRTLALAADLLDLARSEHGRLQLHREPIDVGDAVRAAVSFLPVGQQPVVAVAPALTAELDPARFEQIVVNLVSNAYRHGRPPVTVTAGPAPDGGLLLVVADQGEGVPADQVAGLFRPFAEGSRSDSVGLGLWIVQELVGAHGGTVRYEDHDDGGARFVVELPAAPAAPADEADDA